MAERPLTPEESALWARVMASVRSIRPAPIVAKIAPAVAKPAPPPPGKVAKRAVAKVPASAPTLLPAKQTVKRPSIKMDATLDGSWDKQISRGLVSPDRSIDLHGHNLATAYATLDRALGDAIAGGDRVVLLVTGKPPRAESERPHARGAIRAAVGDWLQGSRHAAAIAAVRGAHPRHGGTGALYIVLRRPRSGG